MLDEMEGRIWARHHQAFSDWADAALARIAATLRGGRAATLLAALAALGLSTLMVGGTVA
jgi:hypothetical protein